MSNITKDIRTIAKTELLEEKLAVALTAVELIAKELDRIAGERGIAEKTGTTLGTSSDVSGVDATTNLPGSGGEITGGTGSNIVSPNRTAVELRSHQSDIINEATDKLADYSKNNSLVSGSINGNPKSSPKTDLTAQAYSPIKGGSDTSNFAQGAIDDATLEALLEGAADQGATAAALEALSDQYLQDNYAEPGTFTAYQLAENNEITPQLSADPDSMYKEKLRSVVGWDSEGTISAATGAMLAVKVLLDSKDQFPIPNAADLAADGQSAWDDWNIPPNKIGWDSGYYWTVNGFEEYSGATPGDAIDQFIIIAIQPTFPTAYWDPSTLEITGASPPHGATFTYYHEPGGSPITTATMIQQLCSGGGAGASTCVATNPLEEYWPKTGSFVLNLTDGVVTVSEYDSEKTIYYAEGSSFVRLKIGDGVNIIDDRFMDLEPAVDGGLMLVVRDSSFNFQFANYYNKDRVLTRAQIPEAEYRYFKPKR